MVMAVKKDKPVPLLPGQTTLEERLAQEK